MIFNSWCSGAASALTVIAAIRGDWGWCIALGVAALLSLAGAYLEHRASKWPTHT